MANKIWFPRFQQPRQPINAHCGTVSAFTCETENNFKQKLLILHFAETAILQNLKSDEVLEMKIYNSVFYKTRERVRLYVHTRFVVKKNPPYINDSKNTFYVG